MKNDIKTIEDIKIMVDTFYQKIKLDGLLSPIFNQVIIGSWQGHLEIMYRFWQSALGVETQTPYRGNPFMPHLKLPISQKHFDQWIYLFEKNMDENFEGEMATKAKWQAHTMANLFISKLDYYRNNDAKPLI